MKKYKCKICGHIYDEDVQKMPFDELSSDWKCPKCGVPKDLFEIADSGIEEDRDEAPSNAIKIHKENVAISRIIDKCINCGLCKTTCKQREGMDFDRQSELCINCGQCVQTCPVSSLVPKNDIDQFLKAKEAGKIAIAYISPSTRVAFGDIFNLEPGQFTQGKLVGFLKQMGFDYVLDTTFAADLTIMEEANELVDRIKNKKTLPMFTSCCPAWVKYAEQFYPGILDHISTCKSPIGMMGVIVKKYFTQLKQIDENNTYTVAITPCTAKKYEINRPEISDTDLVLTLYELEQYINDSQIKYEDIIEQDFDLLKEGSGAGVIFGNTGGVMEAALRTGYYVLTNHNLAEENIVFHEVRGYNGLREAEIKINDLVLNVAIIDGMSNAKKVLEEVANGLSKYHYIEIMNCAGGCIGGGGQPKINMNEEKEIKEKRIASLYQRDKNAQIRYSHENPDIIEIYKTYLEKPLGSISKEQLHTKYVNRSILEKELITN